MNEKEILERVKILFKAYIDMYNSQDETPYVIGVQEATAIWDDCECDGGCLKEEMECLYDEIEELLKEQNK